MCVGKKRPARPACAKTHSEPAAGAEGYQALMGVVAVTQHIGIRIEEGSETLQSIRSGYGEDATSGQRRKPETDYVPHFGTRGCQHRKGRCAYQDRRSEIRLDHQETTDASERDHHRPEDVTERIEIGLLSGEHHRQHDDYCKLGKLRSLDCYRTDFDPAPGATGMGPGECLAHAGTAGRPVLYVEIRLSESRPGRPPPPRRSEWPLVGTSGKECAPRQSNTAGRCRRRSADA